MGNINQKRNPFKKSLILFIIGLLLVLASVFAIWVINDILRGPIDASPSEAIMDMNFIGWLVCILLCSVLVTSVILLIVSACTALKVVFKTQEHPIKNSFVVHLFSVLGIIFVGLILVISQFLNFTIQGYVAWLIYASTIILLITVVYVTCLIKFIIELIKDWKLVRTAILETRVILGNRINKQ